MSIYLLSQPVCQQITSYSTQIRFQLCRYLYTLCCIVYCIILLLFFSFRKGKFATYIFSFPNKRQLLPAQTLTPVKFSDHVHKKLKIIALCFLIVQPLSNIINRDGLIPDKNRKRHIFHQSSFLFVDEEERARMYERQQLVRMLDGSEENLILIQRLALISPTQ